MGGRESATEEMNQKLPERKIEMMMMEEVGATASARVSVRRVKTAPLAAGGRGGVRRPPTDPAARPPPPGIGATAAAPPGAPPRAPPGAPVAHLRLVGGGMGHTGDADSRHMEVIPGRAHVGGVRWGAGPLRLVSGE